MARTRKTSKEALEEKIKKAEADVIAAKKKYDQIGRASCRERV